MEKEKTAWAKKSSIQTGGKSLGNTPGTTKIIDLINNVTVIIDSATGRVISAYV